jgi:peptide/nickel transport system substrate-binding protein
MGQQAVSRRDFVSYVIVGGGTLLLGACTSGRATRSNSANGTGASALPPIEGGTVVTDPAQFPTKLSESPDFAKLVAEGKLPPVAERVGQDPLVIKPLQSVGKYGGEIRRGFTGAGDTVNGTRFCAGPDTLLFWDYQLKEIVPNLARGYKLSADGKVMTLHLRRGMRWSDGHPFTADDIIFWREDINLNPELPGGSPSLLTAGGPVQVRKVDDYTVEYVAPVPHPLLPTMMASSRRSGLATGPIDEAGYAPKHYLSQFLPKYTSEAEATRKAKAAGAESWALHVQQRMDWPNNPDLPVLTPWVVTRPINNAPWVLEANPYSIWVDSQGNQLPYIPKITMRDSGNSEVLKTQAASGAYDFQDRGLDLTGLQVLLQNQRRSKYTIYRAPNDDLNLVLRLNLAYAKDKTIGDLLRNVDFRRALSLGINRDEINKTFLFDTGVPTASMVGDDSPYFPGKEWRTKWATHDVAQANQLLDKIGLTKRDGDGFRLRPDGKGRVRMDFDATKSYADFPGVAEMVKRHWREIGIDASVQTVDAASLTNRILANEVMVNPLGGFSTDVFVDRLNVLAQNNNAGVMGVPYAQWFDSGGKKGVRPPESLRLQEAFDLLGRGLRTVDDAERAEIGKRIYMLHADMVWSIGLVGFAPLLYGLYLAKNNLGNVPRRVLNDQFIHTPSNALPMTFYYK